jgi:hypothetical protein
VNFLAAKASAIPFLLMAAIAPPVDTPAIFLVSASAGWITATTFTDFTSDDVVATSCLAAATTTAFFPSFEF